MNKIFDFSIDKFYSKIPIVTLQNYVPNREDYEFVNEFYAPFNIALKLPLNKTTIFLSEENFDPKLVYKAKRLVILFNKKIIDKIKFLLSNLQEETPIIVLEVVKQEDIENAIAFFASFKKNFVVLNSKLLLPLNMHTLWLRNLYIPIKLYEYTVNIINYPVVPARICPAPLIGLFEINKNFSLCPFKLIKIDIENNLKNTWVSPNVKEIRNRILTNSCQQCQNCNIYKYFENPTKEKLINYLKSTGSFHLIPKIIENI